MPLVSDDSTVYGGYLDELAKKEAYILGNTEDSI